MVFSTGNITRLRLCHLFKSLASTVLHVIWRRRGSLYVPTQLRLLFSSWNGRYFVTYLFFFFFRYFHVNFGFNTKLWGWMYIMLRRENREHWNGVFFGKRRQKGKGGELCGKDYVEHGSTWKERRGAPEAMLGGHHQRRHVVVLGRKTRKKERSGRHLYLPQRSHTKWQKLEEEEDRKWCSFIKA